MSGERFVYAMAIESAGSAGQDRAVVVSVGDRLVLALADGAGGTGGGAIAAQAIVDALTGNPERAADCESLLLDLDERPHLLGSGQTTAVIATLTGQRLAGASVGDSGAWIISGTDVLDVTADQERKPLVGSGCVPVAFDARFPRGGTLLVASDGLLRYAKRTDIARIATEDTVEAAARKLVELVRLRSGGLQDDTSVILVRRAGAS